MGTRADFYDGRGPSAEWLGSIAWDGYPEGVEIATKAEGYKTADEWRGAVSAFLAKRDDATLPEQGWPWPWDDSRTTDYAYAYENGQVMASCFGYPWFDPTKPEPDDPAEVKGGRDMFPDMSARKAVTLGKRSGIMLIESRGVGEAPETP